MTKVHARAWQPTEAEVSHAARLDAKIARLGALICPKHLDIPDTFRGSEHWHAHIPLAALAAADPDLRLAGRRRSRHCAS